MLDACSAREGALRQELEPPMTMGTNPRLRQIIPAPFRQIRDGVLFHQSPLEILRSRRIVDNQHGREVLSAGGGTRTRTVEKPPENFKSLKYRANNVE